MPLFEDFLYLKQHPVKLVHNMDENVRRVEAVLQEACSHINEFYEVDDLCNSLPDRLRLLADKEGDMIKY